MTAASASRAQEELDSTDTSVVISSCSLAEARLLLDNFLKASIDKVGAAWPWAGAPGTAASVVDRPGSSGHVTDRLGQAAMPPSPRFLGDGTLSPWLVCGFHEGTHTRGTAWRLAHSGASVTGDPRHWPRPVQSRAGRGLNLQEVEVACVSVRVCARACVRVCVRVCVSVRV